MEMIVHHISEIDNRQKIAYFVLVIEEMAPNMVKVIHDEKEYPVDLLDGVGGCPDYKYRDYICKHIIKAALYIIYTTEIQTPIVARIAQYATEHLCPADNHNICDGPSGPGYPCPSCVAAIGVDDYTI